MRVDRAATSPTAPGAPPRPAQAPGFAALLESAAPLDGGGPARPAGAAQAAASAADIYAVAAQAEAADQHARRHGRAMLQALAALQLAILGGSQDDARAQLARLAAQPAQADDPVLRLILREIGARAAVELARADT